MTLEIKIKEGLPDAHVCDENCIVDPLWGCAKEGAQLDCLTNNRILEFNHVCKEGEDDNRN